MCWQDSGVSCVRAVLITRGSRGENDNEWKGKSPDLPTSACAKSLDLSDSTSDETHVDFPAFSPHLHQPHKWHQATSIRSALCVCVCVWHLHSISMKSSEHRSFSASTGSVAGFGDSPTQSRDIPNLPRVP